MRLTRIPRDLWHPDYYHLKNWTPGLRSVSSQMTIRSLKAEEPGELVEDPEEQEHQNQMKAETKEWEE